VHGKDKNLGVRHSLPDLTRDLHSVQLGHADIHDGHIGLQLLGHFNRFCPIGCFAHDFPAGAGLEEPTRATPDQRVIVS
jgi:hypothetical protein